MSVEKTSVLLKKKINVHGEIHLDHIQASLLIELIEADERYTLGVTERLEGMIKIINKHLLKVKT